MPKKNKRGKKKRGAKKAVATTAAKPADDLQKLPAREEKLFKDVMKLYENKSYKKCLKICDNILKKHPNHGETLSMKGLTLNGLGRSEEAHEFCKKGLRANMKSHVTWHVYGLLYRAEKRYDKAVQSYKQALKIAPDNMQIMRDIALLQIQSRDLAGFVTSQNNLLQKKSNNRGQWMGFAVANYLNKQYDTAIKAITAYRKTLPEADATAQTYENSELALFENLVLESKGDSVDAVIAHLDKFESVLTDKLEYKQRKTKLFIKAGRYDEACQILRMLLAENPENYSYHRGVQCCLLKDNSHCEGAGLDLPVLHVDLSVEQKAQLLEMYDVLALQQPRCAAHRHIPLMFTSGDEYNTRMKRLMVTSIRKVKDTFFAVLKPIYKRELITSNNSAKLQAGLAYLIESEKTLTTSNKLPGETQQETPTSILCTYLYIAQHLDLKGDHERALEYIEKAIAHTPTYVELYMVKAQILKHSGDIYDAASTCDYGRKLDLADRYINCQTSKYLYRANRIEEAEKIVVLFSKTDGEYKASLFDMQCMWYELAAAEAYLRTRNYKMALKKFGSVEKHWADIKDDQFDFHGYCMRKSTIRAYLEMIRMEDNLGEHPFYLQGTLGMIRTYIAMHTNPQPKTAEEIAFESMTKEQKRNFRRKQKKIEEEKAEAAKAAQRQKLKNGRDKTDEPDEEQLYKVEDKLAEAWKYVEMLQKRNPKCIETHLAHVDVALLMGDPALALKGIDKALVLDKMKRDYLEDVAVQQRALRVIKAADALTTIDEKTKQGVEELRQKIVGESASLSQFCKTKIQDMTSSGCTHDDLITVCESATEVDVSLGATIVASALCAAFTSETIIGITHKTARRAQLLLEGLENKKQAEDHRVAVLARYPRCFNMHASTTDDAEETETAPTGQKAT